MVIICCLGALQSSKPFVSALLFTIFPFRTGFVGSTRRDFWAANAANSDSQNQGGTPARTIVNGSNYGTGPLSIISNSSKNSFAIVSEDSPHRSVELMS